MDKQLEMIEKALATTNARFLDNSPYFILWGCLSLSGIVLQHALLTSGSSIFIMWAIIIGLGFVGQLILARQSSRQGHGSVTFQEKAIATCWALIGVAMLFIAFVAPNTGLISYQAIQPLLMLQLWIGSFFTGVMLKFRPLKLLCNIWLISLGLALLYPSFSALYFGLALLIGYILPALLMRRSAQMHAV